jgi:hypothetical protein
MQHPELTRLSQELSQRFPVYRVSDTTWANRHRNAVNHLSTNRGAPEQTPGQPNGRLRKAVRKLASWAPVRKRGKSRESRLEKAVEDLWTLRNVRQQIGGEELYGTSTVCLIFHKAYATIDDDFRRGPRFEAARERLREDQEQRQGREEEGSVLLLSRQPTGLCVLNRIWQLFRNI